MVLASNSLKFLWVETFNIISYLVNQSPMKTNFNIILEEKSQVQNLNVKFQIFLLQCVHSCLEG